ncbi:MAG: pitrilysin family protein [Thermodesulfobacteriota bacterium]
MHNKTVLSNGVRIITETLDHFRSVSLGIWIGVGSRDETEQDNGISHFIEHMIFKGTGTRTSPQIAKQLDAIGGLSNAFTSTEYTCFHSRVLEKDVRVLVDILSDIFLNSTFDPAEMDRERQVILQEISMLEDTPDEQIHVLFNELHWKRHPLGMPVMGTPVTVSAIHRKDIQGHMRQFHAPRKVLLVAAGAVDHEGLVNHFRPLFESLPSSDANRFRSGPGHQGGVCCHYKDLEQVHISLGGKAPYLRSEMRFAAAVLNTILGGNMSSRLFQEIREKRGLAYSVYSFLTAYIDAGVLGVYLATDPSDVNQALQIICKEIRAIQKGDVTQSDLAETKEHLIGGILLGSESTDARMMRLAKNEYVFERYVSCEEVIDQIERVSRDQVVAVAEEAFGKEGVSLVTLGPLEEKDLDAGCLEF